MTVVTLTTPYGLTSHNLNGRTYPDSRKTRKKKKKRTSNLLSIR
ncbi:MAG: hypothetical protein U5N86_05695 [Planctomycetota bacterium]|nr:hypothetical protein [Planctomycetota bacterium]